MSPTPQRHLEAGAVYDLLSEFERRQVVAHLRTHDETAREDLVERIAGADAGHSDERRVEIALVHNHLPRLDDADVVEHDRERGTVARGDRFADVVSVVDAIPSGAFGSQSPLLE